MNYEKRYKEALEGIRELYNSDCDMIRVKRLKRRLKLIFPELKESEDDRIRREIIDFLRLPHRQFAGKRDHEKWIAWLEKQDEKKLKFCEGDKVMSNQDGKVYTVGTAYYITGDNICLHGTDGNHKWTNEDDLNRNYHLWTIDDAKKGDILVVDGTWIVEFDKKMTDGCTWKEASILTSFEYDMDDDICTTGSHMFYVDIWPASKKDIDLFKKKRNEYLASNSHNESKLKVGDKVVINCREEFATTYNGKEGTIIRTLGYIKFFIHSITFLFKKYWTFRFNFNNYR